MNQPPITDQELQDAIVTLQLKLAGKYKHMALLPLKVLHVQIDFMNTAVIDTLRTIPFSDKAAPGHGPVYDELSKLYEEIALCAVLGMITTRRYKTPNNG